MGVLVYMTSIELEMPIRVLPELDNKRIGIIGMGRIGEALVTQLVESHKRLGLDGVLAYSRPKNKEIERVQGVINQVSTMDSNFNIDRTGDFYELGQNSGVIIVVIGRREGGNKTREDLTGQYFRDIKEVMEGIKDSKATLLIATNPVTPNCLVARLYSQQEKPNIIGFTRLDYIRAKHILTGWLRKDFNSQLKDTYVEVDVLGPHGYGLLVTNIRVGSPDKKRNHIYNNQSLSIFFDNFEGRIERLSEETAEYGESTYRDTAPEGTPSVPAVQISESLYRILNGGKDTAAIDINLSEMCRSGLELPRGPTYASVPVIYFQGYSKIDDDFDLSKIPADHRRKLLGVLTEEETRIKDYLLSHKNGFLRLREHFNI